MAAFARYDLGLPYPEVEDLSLRTLDELTRRWLEEQRRQDYRAAATWALLANVHRREGSSTVRLEDGFPSLGRRLTVREKVERIFG